MADKLPPYRDSIAGSLLSSREAVMEQIRPILRDADITEQQWRVLRVLDNSGPMDPSRLADESILSPPSLARILRDLTQNGLLDRQPDPADGRRAIIILTPKGRQQLDETSAHTLKVLRSIREKFGEERVQSLLQELSAFRAAIS